MGVECRLPTLQCHIILALGFPKGGGRVSAPHLTVSNDGLTLIGKNIHDTDPTVSAHKGDYEML